MKQPSIWKMLPIEWTELPVLTNFRNLAVDLGLICKQIAQNVQINHANNISSSVSPLKGIILKNIGYLGVLDLKELAG